MSNVRLTSVLTNRSDRYLVVCDHTEIVSDHATRAEADAALLAISPKGFVDTQWTCGEVVAPFESLAIEHTLRLPSETPAPADQTAVPAWLGQFSSE